MAFWNRGFFNLPSNKLEKPIECESYKVISKEPSALYSLSLHSWWLSSWEVMWMIFNNTAGNAKPGRERIILGTFEVVNIWIFLFTYLLLLCSPQGMGTCCVARLTLNLPSSWSSLPSAGTSGIHQHAQIWYLNLLNMCSVLFRFYLWKVWKLV